MARTRSRAQHSPAAPLDPPAPSETEPTQAAEAAATTSSTAAAAGESDPQPAGATGSPKKRKQVAKEPPAPHKRVKKEPSPTAQGGEPREGVGEDGADGEEALIRKIGQKFSPGDGQLDYVISTLPSGLSVRSGTSDLTLFFRQPHPCRSETQRRASSSLQTFRVSNPTSVQSERGPLR